MKRKKILSKLKLKNFKYDTKLFNELKQFKNDGLVKFLEFYEEKNVFCSVIEAEGLKLSEVFDEQSKLGVQLFSDNVFDLFGQLIFAVDFLHEKNIIHTYINPR